MYVTIKPCLSPPTYSDHIVSGERFELNSNIFVNSKSRPDPTIDETDCSLWVASIVEVRAETGWNVWLRVEWFYRPEELPHGRQPHHGKREIIKSKAQNIISAVTVAGSADVTYWDENDDSKDADGIDGLFWRQTFDPSTRKLSVRSLFLL